ncbi:hypothetical protein Tco_0558507 [Tanacetum coccineum]
MLWLYLLSYLRPPLEAATVVALPTATLDLAIKSALEAEPSESNLFEDESESNEDAPEAAEPLSAQVAPPPPVQITPTSLVESTPALPIIPYDTRATSRMTVPPQPPLPL